MNRLAALHDDLRAAACARWQRATLSRRTLKPANGEKQSQLQLRHRLTPCSDPPNFMLPKDDSSWPMGILLLYFRERLRHSNDGFCICTSRLFQTDSCFSTCTTCRQCLHACVPYVKRPCLRKKASQRSKAFFCRSVCRKGSSLLPREACWVGVHLAMCKYHPGPRTSE